MRACLQAGDEYRREACMGEGAKEAPSGTLSRADQERSGAFGDQASKGSGESAPVSGEESGTSRKVGREESGACEGALPKMGEVESGGAQGEAAAAQRGASRRSGVSGERGGECTGVSGAKTYVMLSRDELLGMIEMAYIRGYEEGAVNG